jgi:hypothetical protein
MMNFWDSRARTIALIESLKSFAPNAFTYEAATRIADAWIVIDGEPMDVLPRPGELEAVADEAAEETVSLPVSKAGAQKCCQWLISNFGSKLKASVAGKPYGVQHLCAIICQETAYKWLKWIGQHDAATIIARCVFDASGDYPGTERSAFPVNTAQFKSRFGNEFTNMLIEEANKTRRMQGWADATWVYKGYGIFQYDLQSISDDESFFRDKLWYSFDSCLKRCCDELDLKLRATHGDLWKAIKAYNGSGAAATRYAANVKVFTDYCADVVAEPAAVA